MPHEITNPDVIRKIQQGMGLRQGKVIKQLKDDIQTVYVCNDETAPVGVHPHGQIPWLGAGGGQILAADNKGVFTNKGQTRFDHCERLNTGVTPATKTWYTVTTGKKLYISDVQFSHNAAAGSALILLQDGTGAAANGDDGLRKLRVFTDDKNQAHHFIVPLEFSTNVVTLNTEQVASSVYQLTLQGWEE